MKTTIRTATILFLATISLSAQELVRNGGFENAEPLEHWSWSSTVQGADLSATTVTVHSGNNSAKIRLGTNPLNVYSILRQTISTPENNTEYRLSFWIKGILAANMGGIYGTKGAREFPLGNDEKNNNDVIQSDAGSFRIKLNQISDWTKVEYYFDSGSDYSKYSLIFGVTTSGDSYDIFVDDFFIERIGPSPKQITMLSPNGGELWNAGEQYNITWDSEGVTNVLIEYSTNNGVSWQTAVASTPASIKSFLWTVPNVPSTSCKVRISDVDDSDIKDESDALFTIVGQTPEITVQSPNGGELWNIGSAQIITWTSQLVDRVKIEYSTNNGSTWSTVIASTPAFTESYEWTIPNTPSTWCKVRISDAADPAINDESNIAFTIKGAAGLILVDTPNGGESWQADDKQFITWTSLQVVNVKIEYSTDNGDHWSTIIASTAASAQSYEWTIPNTPSTLCKVRISDAGQSSTMDESDGVFTIETSSLPSGNLVKNGGFENNDPLEQWRWNSIVDGAEFLATSDQPHSGKNTAKIRLGTHPVNTSYSTILQTILTPEPQTEYRLIFWIKGILYHNVGGVYGLQGVNEVALGIDDKNNTNVTSPENGSFSIKLDLITNWTKVEYYFNSGSNFSEYTLKFAVATPGTPYDVFVDDFAIEKVGATQSKVTLISPNGGEEWSVDEKRNITWSSQNISNVKIEYSADSGGSWSTIAASTPASAQSYLWTIPDIPSSLCKVRLSDAVNADVNDESDSVFKIIEAIIDPAQDIVQNGGFENIDPLEFWRWNSVVNGAELLSTTEFANSGQGCAKINLGTDPIDDVYSTLSQTLGTLEVNTEYCLTFWIKGILQNNFGGVYGTDETEQVALGIDLKNDTSVITPENGSFAVKLGLITNWTKVEYYFHTGDGYSEYTLKFAAATLGTPYDVFLDDFIITEMSVVPVELASFTALISPAGIHNGLLLKWKTVSETNNLGFDIERSIANDSNWKKIGFVEGHGTTSDRQQYTFADPAATTAETFFYRLKQIDSDGTFEYSSIVEFTVRRPEGFILKQNYPNPFNPTTTIVFSLPTSEFVSLTLFNLLGHEIKTLVHERKAAGSHSVTIDAALLESGSYFYRLEAGDYSDVKRMTVVK